MIAHLDFEALRFQSCRHLCQQALAAGSKVPKTAHKLQMQAALQQDKLVLAVDVQEALPGMNKRMPTAGTGTRSCWHLHDLWLRMQQVWAPGSVLHLSGCLNISILADCKGQPPCQPSQLLSNCRPSGCSGRS